MDLLDRVFFCMDRIFQMNFWLVGKTPEEGGFTNLASTQILYEKLLGPMSKLMRLYISMAVFVAKASHMFLRFCPDQPYSEHKVTLSVHTGATYSLTSI